MPTSRFETPFGSDSSPGLVVSTRALTITGGHLNHTGLAPEIDERVPQLGTVADTVDEMIKEVRRQVKYGADWIKVYATGTTRHIAQELGSPPTVQEEQIRAVVTEARRWRKDVAAHAYGGEGARAAVLGGARSIEHGMLLDESILNLMVKHGRTGVPLSRTLLPPMLLWDTPSLSSKPSWPVTRGVARAASVLGGASRQPLHGGARYGPMRRSRDAPTRMRADLVRCRNLMVTDMAPYGQVSHSLELYSHLAGSCMGYPESFIEAIDALAARHPAASVRKPLRWR